MIDQGAHGFDPPPPRLPPPASLGALLDELAGTLRAGGVADAGREARDVVAALLDVSRAWPRAHRSAPVGTGLRERALAAAGRIAAGEPFAYAVGRASFRHLTLEVDARVLIPRPETELLVELALRTGSGGVAADVGTGSGAVAVALATEGRFDRVIATDVSADALAVAWRNAQRLATPPAAPVELRLGSLLAPLRGERLRAVVSNPPYVAYAEAAALPPAVRDWEPAVALFSDADGLAATASLVREAAELLEDGGLLALEVDTRRAARVAALAAADGRYRDVAVHPDLTGRERFVTAWKSHG